MRCALHSTVYNILQCPPYRRQGMVWKQGVVFLVHHLYCIVVHCVLDVYQFLGTAGTLYGSVLFVYVATRRIVYGIVVRCTCYHKWYSTVNPTVNSFHTISSHKFLSTFCPSVLF